MISRRKFTKGLSALSAMITATLLVYKKPKGFKLTTLKVAGLQYGDASKIDFKTKTPLTLQREPTNTHDPHAVAIYYTEKKVGYIPRDHSKIIASLLDNGISLDVRVRYFDGEKKPWERMWVSVWQVG